MNNVRITLKIDYLTEKYVVGFEHSNTSLEGGDLLGKLLTGDVNYLHAFT